MKAKSFRLSGRAKASYRKIGLWTRERFGSAQAEIYLTLLLDQCRKLAAGQAHHRSCRDVFAPDAREDLRFARAGEHYVIFVESTREVLVVDFIHSRLDLPGKVAGMGKG
ncbi:MAG: type II toxin-antitoxin system RelE/ParE family toxin [Proteobacteria bacterium]|nr:type II toxin-antitoxin system RelE/ParE family toxin [Pseudomonadota bacterium]MBS0571689.1 type II toxin-antitoxin system RelE/ParE family toxin [Pseudomonadota bacterium]